jgi:hypothetical protein
MRTLAQKSAETKSASSPTPQRAHPEKSRTTSPIEHLRRTMGNQALQRFLDDTGIVQDRAPDPGKKPQSPGSGSGTAVTPAATKKAGVKSFVVTWSKSPLANATTLSLRLEFAAEFKKDAAHDPALAEFRQNAFHKLVVTAGPHKGLKDDNSPLHDDNYSRADDPDHARTDTTFRSNDHPGTKSGALDKDDVVDYSFTAEQLIVDTSAGNQQIAKKGPHTATIKGKHPRTVGGVPKTL